MSFNNLPAEAKEAILNALNAAAEDSEATLELTGSVDLEIRFVVDASISLEFEHVRVAERSSFEHLVKSVLIEGDVPRREHAIIFKPGAITSGNVDDGAIEEAVMSALDGEINALASEFEQSGSFDSVYAEVQDVEIDGLFIENDSELDSWRYQS